MPWSPTKEQVPGNKGPGGPFRITALMLKTISWSRSCGRIRSISRGTSGWRELSLIKKEKILIGDESCAPLLYSNWKSLLKVAAHLLTFRNFARHAYIHVVITHVTSSWQISTEIEQDYVTWLCVVGGMNKDSDSVRLGDVPLAGSLHCVSLICSLLRGLL